MTYSELNNALVTFGFSGQDLLTMTQIKRRQRELSRNNHPDLVSGADPLTMPKINAAAAVITEYLRSYRFSFSEEKFYRQNPDEFLRKQFASDPWGSG